MNTLGVLYRAAENKRFDEFYNRLNKYYENEGRNVPVNNRSFARNIDHIILEDIVKKESEISEGKRDSKDRKYWPKKVQELAQYQNSVKVELFFYNCYKEIMG